MTDDHLELLARIHAEITTAINATLDQQLFSSVTADTTADSIIKLIGPKTMVWRRMDAEFVLSVNNPWLYKSTNHMYQLYDKGDYWTVMMGSLVIKFDSCLTLNDAKAAAQEHHDTMWWESLK